jgi:hypothetical protein
LHGFLRNLEQLFNFLHRIHVAPVSLIGWKKRVEKENFDPDFEEFFFDEQPQSWNEKPQSSALKRQHGS